MNPKGNQKHLTFGQRVDIEKGLTEIQGRLGVLDAGCTSALLTNTFVHPCNPPEAFISVGDWTPTETEFFKLTTCRSGSLLRQDKIKKYFTHIQDVNEVLDCNSYSALPSDPNNLIFSITVALIASVPGANNLRGSNPFPSKSLPASIYLRVASANDN